MPTAWGDCPPLPQGTTFVNGTVEQKLDRLAIREICEGWPTHRDAQEWPRYRPLFDDDAYIFTTWSGGCTIDEFIEVSKKGFQNGDRIMHQAIGTTVETKGDRAIAKMKAVITQRFKLPAQNGNGEVEVDVECQNRFTYFLQKNSAGDWKIKYYKVFYEKDHMIPVNPLQLPKLDDKLLESIPYGYRFLGYCQSLIGHKVLHDLPEAKGGESDRLYEATIAWMDGKGKEDVDKLLKINRK
ncbi:hypothetical protein C364_06419 [Cryptococcus neoformans Bt63]|nr:hypothetical protein C364_06419 [Cryptococcus neoformans var. grubii Bt63]